MVFGSPFICMRTIAAPASRTTANISGSLAPEMSFTISAPASRAAPATAGFRVSTEMGTGTFAASVSITGTTRSRSSSGETGSDPGRVDSPPTSMRSAPSSTISIPRITAAP